MFGIFNLTREESLRGKENKNENNDEPCYGGFSSRFDYEDCRNHRLRPATAFLFIAVFFFVGVTISAAAIIAYDFVQRNSMLYYPGDAVCTECPEQPRIVPAPSSMDEIDFVSVTSEQSVRYRIPRGVMVKVIKPAAAPGFDDLAAGDIIVAVNENEISSLEELQQFYTESDGSSVTFRVFRKNRYIDVVVEPAEN